MSSTAPSSTSDVAKDDCSICLQALTTGAALLTLSCGHKFHLQCLTLSVKSDNKVCPLCRTAIESSISQLLSGSNNNTQQQPQQLPPVTYSPFAPMIRPVLRLAPLVPPVPPVTNVTPSVEEPVDEDVIRAHSTRTVSSQETAVSSTSESFPLITASTILEFGGQNSDEETNIYGLVTLKAPSITPPSNTEASSAPSRVPVDLVCVVDQSGSMGGEKMILLKETLVYIVEQLNEYDRLAIVSFDTRVFDRSHGLKRMNEANQERLKRKINDDIHASGGTYIGCGLEKGIQIFTQRQTKNPLAALLLLTDGQDNQVHDYSPLMQTLPEDVVCHTFGYGSDHSASLLSNLAEQGNDGTFIYVDEQQAVGPAFATLIGGLLSCVAQNIRVNIEFDEGYQVTHVHSKYKHEPEQLPSSKITYILKDLNADEQRNLIFQLHVPKINTELSVDMLSQEPMSQSLSTEEQAAKAINNNVIGHVSITYINARNGAAVETPSVLFHLIRSSQLSADLLQVNHTLDRQRNRVETALVLKQAMDEADYQISMAILTAQVLKIQASVSAQDPFCQQLIHDLQQRYANERAYRSTNFNSYVQQATERGTYSSPVMTSSARYQTPHQQMYVDHYQIKRQRKS